MAWGRMGLAVREMVWLPITLAAVLGIYLFGLDNPPVFDDRLLVSGDLFAQYGYLQEAKPRLFSYSTFTWVRDLFGEGWWKQRLVNLTVHVAVILALWGFYRDLLRHVTQPAGGDGGVGQPREDYFRSPALGLAIACFALNPAAVYAVAYLIQRSILLATLFTVLALWSFLRGLDSGRPVFHLVAILCYLLAVASKEHAIMAPLAAVPIYVLATRPSPRRLVVTAGAGLLLLGGAATLLLSQYDAVIGQPFDAYSKIFLGQLAQLGPDVERHAFPLSIINQAYLFFAYGLRWLFPYAGWMSIDLRPPFPVELLGMPHSLGIVAYAAVLVGGAALVWRYRDWRALVGLSLLLPATLFMTEFATIWVQDPFVLYRSYLWAIGLPGLAFFLFHGIAPRVLLPIGLLIGLLFVWQALDRVYSLSSQEKVWNDAIAKLPDDDRSVGRWFAYLNRGNALVDQDRIPEAARDFRAASALGDGGIGQYNYAALLYSDGRFAESLEALDEALKLGYDLPGLYFQEGAAMLALGRQEQARGKFDQAMAKQPSPTERAEILALRGRAALELGDLAAATADVQAVLAVQAGHDGANLTLGMIHLSKQQYAEAEALFSRLMAAGEHAPLSYGRAVANFGLQRKAAALADIDTAIRLDPANRALLGWRERIVAMPER